MAIKEFGELSPPLTIQQDPQACLSACLSACYTVQLNGNSLPESEISEILSEDGLYDKSFGSTLQPAEVLNNSLNSIGLKVSPIYDARTLSQQEDSKIVERLSKIDQAIRDGQTALLAFPKVREGEDPFLHYCIVSGFREDSEGSKVVILDPSDIDGGIKTPAWEELSGYVTPLEGIPVMAWGISQHDTETKISQRRVEETDIPGLSLLSQPLYKEEDTGKQVPPDTNHPSSVVMPTAEITKQFADLGDIVLSRDGRQALGYPRFIVNPIIKDLSRQLTGSSDLLPFPSFNTAEAASYMEATYGGDPTITEKGDLYWLSPTKLNSDAWQATGLGISSRQALAVQDGRGENDIIRRKEAEQEIKASIESYTGAKPEDIYLFPTGMSAIHLLNQALIRTSPGSPAVQFGFPYVDTYDQRKFGPKRSVAENMLDLRTGDYDELQHIIDSGQTVRSVMTEYPSNPLLSTSDFERLDKILDGKVPIIIDDTIGTFYNLDDSLLPDNVAARVTSLTKFFSSVGDVMGGSIILRPESPHYEKLKEAIGELYEDTIWYEDAETLAKNSKLFPELMPKVNRNAEQLASWLNQEANSQETGLQKIYYPSLENRHEYDAVRNKERGGYGGLMSLRFKTPEQGFAFFDEIRVTKGPSLGTFYTLGCLYTLLAHKPLGSVERFGVTPDLVRISVGMEDIDDLQDRFDQALTAVS